ncbi:MAG TPA: M67 family metallopeptidase [Candidatus Polarisedimenticolia bacterium]|nr:M67 family metallopeptidase [Candidatus Polarisedimenticolia bacterium]
MLTLTEAAERAMKEHAEQGYPHEVCGLLIGLLDEEGRLRRVRKTGAARNLNRDRPDDRYELDPSDFLRIEREAKAERLDVLGVYHSHPDHPSIPSETDRLRAEEIWQSAESWSYVILQVVSGRVASRRSWILRDGVFAEEEMSLETSAI